MDADERCRQLLQSTTCVLATASLDGRTEAATIFFAADENKNIYFETHPSYRKYKHLLTNPQGSIVITKETHSLQMDGDVTELSGEERALAKQLLIAKLGEKAPHRDPLTKFFKLTPTWIRITEPGYPPKYEVLRE